MYKLSVPVMVNDRFRAAAVLDELKRCGAPRVFLAVDSVPYDENEREAVFSRLKSSIDLFRENGYETGIWTWAFLRLDRRYYEEKCGNMVNSRGELRDQSYCPESPVFAADVLALFRRLAELNPDILMFDDDYRFSYLEKGGVGCYCDRHMEIIRESLGESITREQLCKRIYDGGNNRYRTAFLRALGGSLEAFAARIRAAVDEINPRIRIALCSVMSLWDIDGTDSVGIAKILAGKTKPLLRLIGAPYWAALKSWGNRLSHVIELERMEYAWCRGSGFEIMTEGDVFPRPRYRVPSSFLEGFDTALRFSGTADGILKYMIDYTSSPLYETGYTDRHVKHAGIYALLDGRLSGGECAGVRVYESVKKFEHADFSGIDNPEGYTADMFFSYAARLLADNTVPTVYTGGGMCGIAFGENVRRLPDSALANGLILDIRAARILMQRGIDVGLETAGENMRAAFTYFPGSDEYVAGGYGERSLFKITPAKSARIISYACCDGGWQPDAYLYANENGQRFAVFAFDGQLINEERRRSYCMQQCMFEVVEWLSGRPLPVKCAGNPDAYVLCKMTGDGCVIGLWNFFADEMCAPLLTLDREYKDAEFISCSGRLCGNSVRLDDIPPYSFAFIRLTH